MGQFSLPLLTCEIFTIKNTSIAPQIDTSNLSNRQIREARERGVILKKRKDFCNKNAVVSAKEEFSFYCSNRSLFSNQLLVKKLTHCSSQHPYESGLSVLTRRDSLWAASPCRSAAPGRVILPWAPKIWETGTRAPTERTKEGLWSSVLCG